MRLPFGQYHHLKNTLLIAAFLLLLPALFPAATLGQTFLPSHEWFASQRIRRINIYSEKGDTSTWRQMKPDTARWFRRLDYDPVKNVITDRRRLPGSGRTEISLRFANGQSVKVYDSTQVNDTLTEVSRISAAGGGYPREKVTYNGSLPLKKEFSTPDSLFAYVWSGKDWQPVSRSRHPEKIVYDEFLQPRRRWLYHEGSYRLKERTRYSKRNYQSQTKTRHYDEQGKYLGTSLMFSDRSGATYFHLEQKRFNRRGQKAGHPRMERTATESSYKGGRHLKVRRKKNGMKYDYDYQYDSIQPWTLYEFEKDEHTGRTKYNWLEITNEGHYRAEKDTGREVVVLTAQIWLKKPETGLEVTEKIFATVAEPLRTKQYFYDTHDRFARLTTTMDTTLWQDERWEYKQSGQAQVTVHTVSGRLLGAGPAHTWPWVRSREITVRNAADPFAWDTMLTASVHCKLEVWDTKARLWRRTYTGAPSEVRPPGVQYHFNPRHGQPDAELYENGKMVLYRYEEW